MSMRGPTMTTHRVLAQGTGWRVVDLVCHAGPRDRLFVEQHAHVCVALVASGTFQYRSRAGRELLTPGSILLGNAGQEFECGHEHAAGDRCIAFQFEKDHFERVAAEGGTPINEPAFRKVRIPPVRGLSPIFAQVCAGAMGVQDVHWEELGVCLAAQTIGLLDDRIAGRNDDSPSTVARVTRAVRAIECDPGAGNSLADLAREARLSPYHFLRTFQRLTGLTPHQFVVRMRLRRAAEQLALEQARILDIALDCGFGDVSNFVRAFRSEFGINPRGYQRQLRRS